MDLLLVGGCCAQDPDDDDTPAKKFGLTAWRTLSADPHYKLVTDLEEDLRQVKCRRYLSSSRFLNLMFEGVFMCRCDANASATCAV